MPAKTDNPEWLSYAIKEIGTKEIPGPRSSPRVLQYYMGAAKSDAVPWCAAFVGWCLTKAEEKSSGSLMARSYLRWGKRCAVQPGAIAIWPRGNSKVFGHVNFVERDLGGGRLQCIGGNQSDAVTRQTYSKSKALGFRWPA